MSDSDKFIAVGTVYLSAIRGRDHLDLHLATQLVDIFRQAGAYEFWVSDNLHFKIPPAHFLRERLRSHNSQSIGPLLAVDVGWSMDIEAAKALLIPAKWMTSSGEFVGWHYEGFKPGSNFRPYLDEEDKLLKMYGANLTGNDPLLTRILPGKCARVEPDQMDRVTPDTSSATRQNKPDEFWQRLVRWWK